MYVNANALVFANACIAPQQANWTFLRQSNKAVSITFININDCTTINQTYTESNNNI